MTEAGREGSLKSWKVVSTDGDFMTTSRAFVEVPGVRLVFDLARAGLVMITLQAVVHARPTCGIGLDIDGIRRHFTYTIPELAGPAELVPVAMQSAEMMPAGVHAVRMVMVLGGKGPERNGPKDWSPRRKRPAGARLVRSPEMPVVLMAMTQ